MDSHKKIRVLICDDSALIRQILSAILSSEPDIEVVDTAENAQDAREKIKKHNPDVLTLDIEMPGMDGLSFLEKIMTLRPMPVLMISSLTQKGTTATMKAMELGGFDVIGKPTHDLQGRFPALKHQIVTKVRAASTANVSALQFHKLKAARSVKVESETIDLIAMGASTGGVVALRELLPSLNKFSPPIVVTQHMPPGYTKNFAKRLDQHSVLTVTEAVDQEPLKMGHVYIAPGAHQMAVKKTAAGLKVDVYEGELVSGHMPSVDVLFSSVAELDNMNTMGVILTGMGRDGAEGLLKMRQKGAVTIGQDEATSVVYGMPRMAAEVGAVSKQLPLHQMVDFITKVCWPND